MPQFSLSLGSTFGLWTVIGADPTYIKRLPCFLCKCACGSEKLVNYYNLISNKSKNCGCVRDTAGPTHQTFKHGGTGTPEYKAWKRIIGYCNNQNNPSWSNYGGRGIRVCDQWRNNFQGFLDHIGPKPSGEYTVGRIDDTRNFEPGNVRWVVGKKQAIVLAIGSRFGMLTVTGERTTDSIESSYLCRCDCGTEKQYRASGLTRGWATSCGCKRRKTCSERMTKVNTTHGMVYTPEWKAWDYMIRRCRSDHKSRKDYFDRGITVHPSLVTFEAFLAEVGPCPGPGYSIDRVNNDLGYQPGNLRWATAKDQARNKRSTKLVTHNGKTQCVAAWAEELGLPQSILGGRLNRGWTISRAFYEPLMRQ